MNPIVRIDKFLNGITMYKLVLYGLTIMTVASILMGFLGLISQSGVSLAYSLLILLIVCFALNELCARAFKVPTNVESVFISAYILFFVMAPVKSVADAQVLVVVAAITIASKFLIAPFKRHIFNPVAIALVLAGVMGSGNVTWWVATLWMLPFTLVLGLLVVRKIRRFRLFLSFVIVAVLTISINEFLGTRDFIGTLSLIKDVLVSWPIIFLGTIMLTEPLTTPPTHKMQMIYGAIVGVLFGSQFNVGSIYSTPELALVIGNVFSYIVSFKYRVMMTLKEKVEVAKDIYEFSFDKDTFFYFKPGQYMEWTIKHERPDTRGNRRYFTIASSPSEELVKLGVKIMPEASSSFKTALLNLNVGDVVAAGQLGGDFTLPKDENQKCVLIAGGIGVTPFRSMIKYLIDLESKRSVTLFYSIKSADEIAYKGLWQKASEQNIKVIPVVSDKNAATSGWTGKVGFIDADMIKAEVADHAQCLYYLSGPGAMVDAYKKMLKNMGISHSQIKTDYFPGF